MLGVRVMLLSQYVDKNDDRRQFHYCKAISNGLSVL